jgi:hypothetical protein
MATKPVTINNGKWDKVTNAGENGSIIVKNLSGGLLYLDHSDSAGNAQYDVGAAGIAAGLDVDKAFPLRPNETRIMSGDNASDIYYVAYVDVRGDNINTAVVAVDVV